jgi:hypothetical protein
VAVSSAITQNPHVFLGFNEVLMICSIDEIKFLAREIEWQDGLLLGDILDKLSKASHDRVGMKASQSQTSKDTEEFRQLNKILPHNQPSSFKGVAAARPCSKASQ